MPLRKKNKTKKKNRRMRNVSRATRAPPAMEPQSEEDNVAVSCDGESSGGARGGHVMRFLDASESAAVRHSRRLDETALATFRAWVKCNIDRLEKLMAVRSNCTKHLLMCLDAVSHIVDSNSLPNVEIVSVIKRAAMIRAAVTVELNKGMAEMYQKFDEEFRLKRKPWLFRENMAVRLELAKKSLELQKKIDEESVLLRYLGLDMSGE